MNLKKAISISFTILCLSLIIFQFQNCAAPSDTSDGSANEDGSAGLIDDLVNQKLAFVESLIVIKHDKGTINFDGLCDKDTNGKDVEWEIYGIESDELIQDGVSKCIRGGFRITSDQMSKIDCSVDHKLQAFVGKNQDSVVVRKKCEPLNVVQDMSKKEVFGRECFFELEQNEGEQVCYRSCYTSGKLYDREITEEDSCLIN